MTHDSLPAYGLWGLAAVNAAVFIIFAFSFAKPITQRDWRSFGAFSAFIVALFAEMYGIPLTIYAISGWLQTRYPDLDPVSHDAGHLWLTIFGVRGDPHFGALHILSSVLIIAGFLLLASAWRVLHQAHQRHELATTGPYAHIRHPQYVAFTIILLAFLLQWPTILTLAMFPLLVVMYVRLAYREEAEARQAFGAVYDQYAEATPRWIPHLGGPRPGRGSIPS